MVNAFRPSPPPPIVLDTEKEESFQEVVELASSICRTPISLVSGRGGVALA